MDTYSEQQVTLQLAFPLGEEQIFRYRAMEDILELLIRNPFRAFTVRQLRDLTDNGTKTTTRAVDLLTQLHLVRVDSGGRSKDISLNRDHVTIPDDPLFAIPQDEFRRPIREFTERARSDVPAFSALVVFGSVARGVADRKSDIDVWILVDDTDQLLQARRTATRIASNLADERFVPPHQADSEQRGERYEFEVLVESVETALSYEEELVDILVEGVVIVDSDALQQVKNTVLQGQEVTVNE